MNKIEVAPTIIKSPRDEAKCLMLSDSPFRDPDCKVVNHESKLPKK